MDGPNCSPISLERSVLLVLRLKHGGDSAVVIDSIVCGLAYVANVEERRCFTNGAPFNQGRKITHTYSIYMG